MSPIDDKEKKAIELVATAAGGLHEVKRAAKEAAHEKLRESASRARTSSKTPKSAQTRMRIIKAATELMEERGSMDFQMSEVSDRCHMSKGSIYYYFSDKDELISAIFDEAFASFEDELRQIADEAPDAVSALREIGYHFADACSDATPFAMALASEAVMPARVSEKPAVIRFVRVVAEQLERGKHEGLISTPANTTTLATFSVGGALLTGLVAPAPERSQRIRDGVDGLLSHAGRGAVVEGAPKA